MQVKGKPLIEHLIERIKLAQYPDLIVLCTSTLEEDTSLVDIAKRLDIHAFRGNVSDVLDRCLKAALSYDVDFFAIVEGDEVFCEAEYIDRVIKLFLETDADYVNVDGLPLGAYVVGIKTEALHRLCEIKEGADSDGWPRYFTETGLFHVETLIVEDDALCLPECRMTLDYPEDFELVKEIFDRLYVPGRIFTLREIIALLHSNPELLGINRHLIAVYAEACREFPPIRLKLMANGPSGSMKEGRE